MKKKREKAQAEDISQQVKNNNPVRITKKKWRVNY